MQIYDIPFVSTLSSLGTILLIGRLYNAAGTAIRFREIFQKKAYFIS